MRKTSQSHPLEIAHVEVAGGRLGMTFCPGKKQPRALSGDWDRDLDADLEAVRRWQPAAVVTLIESHELEELEVPELGARIEDAGIDWHHVSIPDAGIPAAVAEARWHYTAARAARLLSEGRGVLLHCKGGLGRTGTMAARLAIQLGWEPDEAIRAVRAARPGAIENDLQESYVRRIVPGQPLPDEPALVERTLGCLLGGAVGDGFGFEVEFTRLAEILAKHGPQGLRQPVYRQGRLLVTDDTQMTMFTAEGLLVAAEPLAAGDLEAVELAIHDAQRRWLSTQYPPGQPPPPGGWLLGQEVLHHQRAPGNTCCSALASGRRGTPEEPINDSKGCGGVMRVAPIGLLGGRLDAEQACDLAIRAAAQTHGHPSGYLSAGVLAATIRLLVDGVEIEPAARKALELIRTRPGWEETLELVEAALRRAAERNADPMQQVSRLGEGWVGEEALAIALYAALRAESFAEAIRIGTNHDGDSDSTASIAAQIYGARHGLADLPHAWVRRLDVFDPLLLLAHDLGTLARGQGPMLMTG